MVVRGIMQNNERNYSYDFMRSVSMLFIIFILHFTQYLGGSVSNWYSTEIARLLTAGALSIYTFLSGILSAKHHFTSKKDVFHYWKGRFVRIYPLFLLTVCGFYLIGLLDTLETVFSAAGYFGCLIPNAPKTLWYVCMLMLFFLIMPVINFFSEKNNMFAIIGFLAFEVILLVDIKIVGGDRRLLLYWPFFFIGNSIARFGLQEKIFRIRNIVISVLISIICVYVIMNNCIKYSTIIELFFGCSLVMTMLFIGKQATKIKQVAWIAQKISYSSYVLYLIHRIVFYLTYEKCGRVEIQVVPILFISMIVVSYMIQYCYDLIIKKIAK